jgi:hypothetical protein
LFGIFCGLCVGYFGGGYAFLRWKQEKPEGERFVHREFWTSLPGLAKDGVSFTKAKVLRQERPSYESV